MRPLLFCLLVGPLIGLTACTSAEEDPPAPATTVDEAAIRDGLAAAFAGDQPGPEAASEGECFADTLMSTTSIDELGDGGIVEEDGTVVAAFPELERDLAVKVVDAQLGCTDFIEDSSRAGIYITKGRLAQEEYAACLRRELPDGRIRDAVTAAVMGRWDDPAIERLSTTQVACARRAER